MPAFNFNPRFVPHILSGRTKHTIRARRSRPFKVGDKIHLFTGMRTRFCAKLMETECVNVENIRITSWWAIMIGDNYLAKDECESFAYADGFDSFTEMMSYWDAALPFEGHIVHWK
jgi:hypothetical protein